MKILLESKTSKGKQRLKEWGTSWEISRRADKVLFSGERGLWFFITPTAIPEHNTKLPETGSRWIHSKRDIDFRILED